jgi:hypothetical protein
LKCGDFIVLGIGSSLCIQKCEEMQGKRPTPDMRFLTENQYVTQSVETLETLRPTNALEAIISFDGCTPLEDCTCGTSKYDQEILSPVTMHGQRLMLFFLTPGCPDQRDYMRPRS